MPMAIAFRYAEGEATHRGLKRLARIIARVSAVTAISDFPFTLDWCMRECESEGGICE
jgi:hypothetical protein